jgi:isoaspartyl peptidase/L-asparaginase-like protein (Ntn-hydrolase superfamily)
MVIDGDTMEMGSVGFLRGVKDAISVARDVMDRTYLTLLAGAGATNFAKAMGYEVLPNLAGPYDAQVQKQWLQANCQPNFWVIKKKKRKKKKEKKNAF